MISMNKSDFLQKCAMRAAVAISGSRTYVPNSKECEDISRAAYEVALSLANRLYGTDSHEKDPVTIKEEDNKKYVSQDEFTGVVVRTIRGFCKPYISGQLRLGQAVFSIMYRIMIRPVTLHENPLVKMIPDVTGTDKDCFYNNAGISRFLECVYNSLSQPVTASELEMLVRRECDGFENEKWPFTES